MTANRLLPPTPADLSAEEQHLLFDDLPDIVAGLRANNPAVIADAVDEIRRLRRELYLTQCHVLDLQATLPAV